MGGKRERGNDQVNASNRLRVKYTENLRKVVERPGWGIGNLKGKKKKKKVQKDCKKKPCFGAPLCYTKISSKNLLPFKKMGGKAEQRKKERRQKGSRRNSEARVKRVVNWDT